MGYPVLQLEGAMKKLGLVLVFLGWGCSPVLNEDCTDDTDCPRSQQCAPEGYCMNPQDSGPPKGDVGASEPDSTETDGSRRDASARDAETVVVPDATMITDSDITVVDAQMLADGQPTDAVQAPPEDATPIVDAVLDSALVDASLPDSAPPDASVPEPDATTDAGCAEGDHCIVQCHPSAEVCNGLDDDCDGQIDDGVLNACDECGPVPGEVCDGIDNDCDGAIDEGCPCGPGYVRVNTTCGRGACLNYGQTACVNGHVVDSCEFDPPVTADDTTCDGIDEDCDGTPDDNFVPARSECGIGACAREGQFHCQDAQIMDTCRPGQLSVEICGNHIDDDCDELTDEQTSEQNCVSPPPDPDAAVVDATVTPPLDASVPPTPDAHVLPMDAAGPVDAQVAVDANTADATIDAALPLDASASPEVCDGIDNDRNGQVDDGLFRPCANACGQQGVKVCVNGNFVECNAPVLVEICDAVDNDCDGQINEDQPAGTCFCKDQDRDLHPDCEVSNGNIGDPGWRFEIPSAGITANDCRDDRPEVWIPGSPRCGD